MSRLTSVILLSFLGFYSLHGLAQTAIDIAKNKYLDEPNSRLEFFILETELDSFNDFNGDDHEEDIKNFLNHEINNEFEPTLLSIEKITPNSDELNKLKYRVLLKWPKPLPNFDRYQFYKNFQIAVKDYQRKNPSLYYYKPPSSANLPGLKVGKAFSATVYGRPVSFISGANNFRNENRTYAGKNLYLNDNYWWEGSARLQVFMDLSRYLNLKNKTKILLTAGYYSSFMNIKKQDDFTDYISNINSEGFKFHGPNYGEFNVGVRFFLDRQKNREKKPPKLF
jgi:hypothetical protein